MPKGPLTITIKTNFVPDLDGDLLRRTIDRQADGVKQRIIDSGETLYGRPIDAGDANGMIVAAYWMGKREGMGLPGVKKEDGQ